MAVHFEILDDLPARRTGIGKTGSQGNPLNRALDQPPDRSGSPQAQGLQHRRHHVDGVAVLRTNLPPGGASVGHLTRNGALVLPR